jgi:hypothetical protein
MAATPMEENECKDDHQKKGAGDANRGWDRSSPAPKLSLLWESTREFQGGKS